jgi:hypothetical protein
MKHLHALTEQETENSQASIDCNVLIYHNIRFLDKVKEPLCKEYRRSKQKRSEGFSAIYFMHETANAATTG